MVGQGRRGISVGETVLFGIVLILVISVRRQQLLGRLTALWRCSLSSIVVIGIDGSFLRRLGVRGLGREVIGLVKLLSCV